MDSETRGPGGAFPSPMLAMGMGLRLPTLPQGGAFLPPSQSGLPVVPPDSVTGYGGSAGVEQSDRGTEGGDREAEDPQLSPSISLTDHEEDMQICVD